MTEIERIKNNLDTLFALPEGERFEILNHLVAATDCKVCITLTREPDGVREQIEVVGGDELLEIERLRAELETEKGITRSMGERLNDTQLGLHDMHLEIKNLTRELADANRNTETYYQQADQLKGELVAARQLLIEEQEAYKKTILSALRYYDQSIELRAELEIARAELAAAYRLTNVLQSKEEKGG